MNRLRTIIVFLLCLYFNGLNPEESVDNGSLVTPSFSLDSQIKGFNSTNLTSGIIVLVDERTLFIADIYQKNVRSINLEFWAGAGDSPENDSSKKLVANKTDLAVSSNIYITLPTDLSLDVINYLEVSLNNQSLAYVNLSEINRTAIPTYNQHNQKDTIYRLPKCCPPDQYINFSTEGCVQAVREVQLNITLFESNHTGLDPNVTVNPSEYQLAPYYQMPNCSRLGEFYRLVETIDIQGIIYNSSLIIEHFGILSHQNFCIDVVIDDYPRDLICHCHYIPLVNPDPNFYLPVLSLSVVGFALSAIAYGLVLKAKDLHKISLAIFCSSMCIAFISLIIMQIQSNHVACNIFGSVFLLTLVMSFLWLLILCLELLYLVKYPIEEERQETRWQWYTGLSVGISIFLFIISLVSGSLGVPDVPSNIIKYYGIYPDVCMFDTSADRAYIVFTPIIISIVGSIISLIVLQIFFNKNENNGHIRNHVDWMFNFNSYKFLYVESNIVLLGENILKYFFVDDIFSLRKMIHL
ncbi:uncharacterized protein LOC126740058 isoform X2 [Anthonomus grandis grandis]|uniref:uncharacterized protein LOC126740058 isoform X2 n=1 Tax=Anthonomus grandis grandis TaxID=2921223 RepID=UPI0021659583|nr:uncharacterized protein LOC126740058 isoform X2 [Anthonomus grandis grandis]